MVRRAALAVVGAIWGLVAVNTMAAFVLNFAPDQVLTVMILHTPHSYVVELLTSDNIWIVLKLLWLPVSVGLDVMVWTVGVISWVFLDQGWPGSALGTLLGHHPTLAWIALRCFSMLSGVVMVFVLAGLLRRVRPRQ